LLCTLELSENMAGLLTLGVVKQHRNICPLGGVGVRSELQSNNQAKKINIKCRTHCRQDRERRGRHRDGSFRECGALPGHGCLGFLTKWGEGASPPVKRKSSKLIQQLYVSPSRKIFAGKLWSDSMTTSHTHCWLLQSGLCSWVLMWSRKALLGSRGSPQPPPPYQVGDRRPRGFEQETRCQGPPCRPVKHRREASGGDPFWLLIGNLAS